MDDDIFCHVCHRFVGLRARCEHCGWSRPAQPSPIGQITWETRLSAEESPPGTPPFPVRITAGSGLIFVPTETGELVAIEAETGHIEWRRPLRADHKLRTLGVAFWNNTLLIGAEHLADLPTRDRSLLAWDGASGQEVWSWPTPGDSLSIPLVHQDTVYFTSSEPRLYALDLATRRQRWCVPSLTWSPDPPAVHGDVVVVPSRGPTVAAYASDDGTRVWTFEADDKETEWLHQRPAVTAGMAFLAGWDKQVYAVDMATGALRWKFSAERGITCPPVLAGDRLLLGIKDYRTGARDRKPGYGLYAIDIATGEVVWQVDTDRHIHISPAVADDLILCGADDRRLRALDARDGRELWQVTLPEKLRAGPLIVGQHVIVGQSNGALVSIQWQVTPPTRPDPNELLAQDRPLEAAVELALLGQYEAAAQLFAKHGQPERAGALYLEANQWDEAATAYVQSGDLDQALHLYRHGGDRRGEADVLALQSKHAEAAPLYEALGELDLAVREYTEAGRAGYAAQLLRNAGRRQAAALLYQQLNQADQAAETLVEDGKHAEAAQVFVRMGKPEVAASVLKQGGQLVEAAALYEQVGNTALAADLYAQAGQMDRALALYEQLQDWHRVAELAEATGDSPRLANALAHGGQDARAAETYERTGLLDEALELYRALAQWDKVRQIAGQLEQWERQAEALEKIGLVSEAGEAYERAAAQAQTRAASSDEIARLYELAAQSYADDENWNRQQACWDQVCRHRQWPNLRGRFELADAFYENEYNQVRLAVRNVGYDVARNVCVGSIGSKFKWDSGESDTSVPCVTYLAPQQDKTILLSLQPRPGVLGRVNLRIKLSYEDKVGQTHQNQFVQSVEVLGRDEKMAVIARQTPTGTTLREDRLTESVLERPRSEAELQLYNGLVSYFNEEELRDLCFQLGIDYETLPGDSKTIKVRELVAYHERRNRIESLSQVCHQLRPNVSW